MIYVMRTVESEHNKQLYVPYVGFTWAKFPCGIHMGNMLR